VSPLERVSRYIDFAVENQMENYRTTGQVLGCPLFTLGSEICTQESDALARLVREILITGAAYFESALRDAQAAGEIDGSDFKLKARQLWAFYEGSLTRARIENNPELLHNLTADAMALMGARTALTAT
jgi:TetR/AcrR family transcriptional repressor of nem operon